MGPERRGADRIGIYAFKRWPWKQGLNNLALLSIILQITFHGLSGQYVRRL